MLTRRTPLTAFVRKLRRPRRGPERSPEYLGWIRTLCCAVCGRAPSECCRIEAAHTHVLGPRGLSQKSSDFSAIPLCFWHHRCQPDSYHSLGEQRFAEAHGIDLRELVLNLIRAYRDGPTSTGARGVPRFEVVG